MTGSAIASLEGQVALVTGADRGLGRRIALDLAASGMAVALADQLAVAAARTRSLHALS